MSQQDTYEDVKKNALAELAQGDAMAAFQTFRRVVSYGDRLLGDSAEKFADAFEVFARIAGPIAGDEFAQHSHKVASNPNNVQALYDLGYALYEQQLYSIAAMVLTRANDLAPNEPAIVSELVCALEEDNLSQAAVKVLSENQQLTQTDFFFAYLLGFNRFMTGDLDGARESLTVMQPLAETDDHSFMLQRMQRFLGRADRVKTQSPLNESDLRGWHYAINDSLLLNLSPFGFPDPMQGRYAYLCVNYESCHKAIETLKTTLDWMSFQPQGIFALPDRNSLITATAISRALSIPMKNWPEAGTDEPGLIVSFNLSEAELPQSLANSRPNQLLYSQLLTWTQSCPVAPDLVYELAQTATPPWGSQMRINPDSNEVEYTDDDERDPALIADEILATDISDLHGGFDEDAPPPPLTREFVKCVAGFANQSGAREKFWANSPVPSARFG